MPWRDWGEGSRCLLGWAWTSVWLWSDRREGRKARAATWMDGFTSLVQREAEVGMELEGSALFAGVAHTGGLNGQLCFSTVLQAGHPTSGCRRRGLLLRPLLMGRWWLSPCVLRGRPSVSLCPPPLFKDISPVGLEPTLVTSFYLLRSWGLGFQHVNVEGHHPGPSRKEGLRKFPHNGVLSPGSFSREWTKQRAVPRAALGSLVPVAKPAPRSAEQ